MLFVCQPSRTSMTWADLFERAEAYETDVETIRETLAARRDRDTEAEESDEETNVEEDDDA